MGSILNLNILLCTYGPILEWNILCFHHFPYGPYFLAWLKKCFFICFCNGWSDRTLPPPRTEFYSFIHSLVHGIQHNGIFSQNYTFNYIVKYFNGISYILLDDCYCTDVNLGLINYLILPKSVLFIHCMVQPHISTGTDIAQTDI